MNDIAELPTRGPWTCIHGLEGGRPRYSSCLAFWSPGLDVSKGRCCRDAIEIVTYTGQPWVLRRAASLGQKQARPTRVVRRDTIVEAAILLMYRSRSVAASHDDHLRKVFGCSL